MAHTTTIIGPETTVQGAVTGQGPLSVEGVVHGQVSLEQELTIAETGSVQGEVRVREAIVHGHLEGTLIATERLILTSSARVTGHIEAPLIRIDDGAHFSGEVAMELEGDAPAAPARQSFTTPARTAPVSSTAARPAPARTTTAPVARPSSPPPAPVTSATTQTATQSAVTTTVVVEEDTPEEEQEPTTEEHSSTAGSNLDPAILAEYDDQTVKELREELRRRDLPVSGTKQELIERLVEDTSS